MPPEIQQLANVLLKNPVKVEVTPVSSTADTIQQALYFVDKPAKNDLLKHLLADNTIKTALVFARTKHGADKVAKELNRSGIKTEAIHGNKSQNARQNALSNFKNRITRVLVATDIAARGIDIDELTHVINYDLPNVPETYVHRIGRTGRAGASGIALSFCDAEEKAFLRDIQKLISKTIPVINDHPFVMTNTNNFQPQLQRPSQRPSFSRRPQGNGNSNGNNNGGGSHFRDRRPSNNSRRSFAKSA
jgi:ATP-dependent RNA helicase RhlE